MMNILKIISACDLYVDRYCQLNDKISYIFIYYFILHHSAIELKNLYCEITWLFV